MKKCVLVFICLAVIKCASSLDCFKCENCNEGGPDTWEKISCGIYGVPIPKPYVWSCLSMDFKNKTTNQEEQVKRCVLAEKKDGELTFSCPLEAGEIRSCQICEKNFCT